MAMNFLGAFVKTHLYLLTGRLHFPRNRVGERISMPDGRAYLVFREVVVDPSSGQPKEPGAIFVPRFHVAGMSPRVNRLFSILPIPFFVGLPGFRSKLWLVHPASGDFAGRYEWDTVQDAESYSRSFAARFMTRRSVPDSVSFEVIPSEQWNAVMLDADTCLQDAKAVVGTSLTGTGGTT